MVDKALTGRANCQPQHAENPTWTDHVYANPSAGPQTYALSQKTACLQLLKEITTVAIKKQIDRHEAKIAWWV